MERMLEGDTRAKESSKARLEGQPEKINADHVQWHIAEKGFMYNSSASIIMSVIKMNLLK